MLARSRVACSAGRQGAGDGAGLAVNFEGGRSIRAARIERLLRKRPGSGSLSGLVRELLAAEADRLGVRS